MKTFLYIFASLVLVSCSSTNKVSSVVDQVRRPSFAVESGGMFPLPIPPEEPYVGNNNAYGTHRNATRKNAGVTLVVPAGTEVFSVYDDGEVIKVPPSPSENRGALQPYAVVVRYPQKNNLTVQYAGLTDQVDVVLNGRVNKGDVIGKVTFLEGQRSRLTVEMYSGTASGPLTQVNNRENPSFNRREDLIDPTPMLLELQKKAFGQ